MIVPTVVIGDVWSRIENADPNIVDDLYDFLSYEVPNSRFVIMNRPGWDGKKRLFRKKGNVAAHSIIDFMTKKKLESEKTNADKAVIVLLRLIGIRRSILDKEGKLIQKKK